jgi:hypothetical protein
VVAQGGERLEKHPRQLAEFDVSLDVLAGDCGLLTDYGVEVRYPDVTEPGEQEARPAVAAAERISAAIRQRIQA